MRFLTRYDGEVSEPLVGRQGSRVSMRVARGAITSLVVMGMLMWTKNPAWNWLWFAIPVIGWPTMMWQMKKEEKPVITFIDKVMKAVWTTIGSIGMLSILLMAYVAHNTHLIIPCTILLIGIGSAISGAVLDNKRIQSWASGTFGFVMIVSLRIAFDETNPIWNHIIFSIAFIGLLVIPGYILNKEAKKHVHPGRQAFISSGSNEPRSALESRRVSLGAHWVDTRESRLLRRLERGREIGL